MSSVFSAFIRSNMLSTTMKVPVRPTPALKTKAEVLRETNTQKSQAQIALIGEWSTTRAAWAERFEDLLTDLYSEGSKSYTSCTINSALPTHSRNTGRRANEQSSFAVSPSWIFRGQKVAFRNRVVLSSNGHKNAAGILATGGRNRQDTDTYLRGN